MAVTDLTPLRIGVTGARTFGSPAAIRAALLEVHERGRPHCGHVLVHGQCDPWHPDTKRPVPWRRAKQLSAEVRGRLLGGDWLAEWVALEMGWRDGISWEIERHPADWYPDGHYDRAAGFRRNTAMVKLGADEWLALTAPCRKPEHVHMKPHDSHGTAHCAAEARRAGIPVTECPDARTLPGLAVN